MLRTCRSGGEGFDSGDFGNIITKAGRLKGILEVIIDPMGSQVESFGLKLPSLERGCEVQGTVVISAKSPVQNTLDHCNFSKKTQKPQNQNSKP